MIEPHNKPVISRCTPEDALLKVEPDHVKQVLHPTFSAEVLESKEYKENIVAVGLAGGPGAAIGKLAFTTEDAEARQSEGVILVRENTSPEVRQRGERVDFIQDIVLVEILIVI